MRLELGQLEITGFKAFVKPQLLDFAKLGPGLHFIRGRNKRAGRLGSNGAAKSTILDALAWCLFGQTCSGLRNTDVRPWRHKAHTQVSLSLKIDGKPYLIVRGLNPNLLTINNEVAGTANVEKLVQLSVSTFSHAICLGQDMELFLDLRPQQKMAAFFEILPSLTRWSERAILAGRVTIELRERLELRKLNLARLESKIEQTGSLIEAYSRDGARWQAEQDAKLTEQDQAIAELKKQLSASQQAADRADLALDSAGLEAKALAAEIAGMQAPMADLRRWRAALAQVPKGATCPTCGQALKGTELARHKRRLETKIGALAATEARLQAATQALGAFQEKARVAEAELSLYRPKVAELEARIAAEHNQAEVQKNVNNPYLSQVRDLKRKLANYQVGHADLTSRAAKLTARIERTHYWVKGFKDLQLYLIEEILAELELVTNSVLADLGLEDWTMSYVIEKETKAGTLQRGLAVLIRSPDTPRPVRWECYSGGERQRLRIAASLALSEVLLAHAGVVPSMIALDEPSHNLSDEGMEDLCAYLAERCRTLGQQCLLIDHLVNPSSHFATTIEVAKAPDGSSTIRA